MLNLRKKATKCRKEYRSSGGIHEYVRRTTGHLAVVISEANRDLYVSASLVSAVTLPCVYNAALAYLPLCPCIRLNISVVLLKAKIRTQTSLLIRFWWKRHTLSIHGNHALFSLTKRSGPTCAIWSSTAARTIRSTFRILHSFLFARQEGNHIY